MYVLVLRSSFQDVFFKNIHKTALKETGKRRPLIRHRSSILVHVDEFAGRFAAATSACVVKYKKKYTRKLTTTY